VLSQRYRPLIFGTLLILAGWLVASAGYQASTNARVTADKVATELRATDLTRLSSGKRAKTLLHLADKVNALSGEERRRVRLDPEWDRLFQQMTDEEKGTFIDATTAPDLKQMVVTFQQLPEPVRQRAIREALRRLKEATSALDNTSAGQDASNLGTNHAFVLSPELQQRIMKSDPKAYFDESSGQIKYELLVLLEEMQRLMESGSVFRGGPR